MLVMSQAGPVAVVVMMVVSVAEMKDATSRYYDYTCYIEKGYGLRLQSHRVDKYISTASLRECQRACDLAFFSCKSFSYSNYPTRERENCLLSREDSRTIHLQDHRDFYYDRDFVFYERSSGRDCRRNNHLTAYREYFSFFPSRKGVLMPVKGS
nr:uncharacterized protein LOC128705416 [Cherax quadricarinatus]